MDINKYEIKNLQILKEAGKENYRKFILDTVEKSTFEEKLNFVDKFKDGFGTYVVELMNKFAEDYDDMPKKKDGLTVNTSSLKAWLRKNDKREVVDNKYNYGYIFLGGNGRCSHVHISKNDREYVINNTAINLLNSLALEEFDLFKKTDEKHILLSKIESNYSVDTMPSQVMVDIFMNRKTDFTVEFLKDLIESLDIIKSVQDEEIKKLEAKYFDV